MNIPTQNTATRMGRLIPTQVGICLLLSFFLLPLSSFADTTFVSGAVSGEWTRDGNPYIVVDSTWVPEGERLTLTAGVEAFFNEGQGLYVFGTMNAEGRENDSVRIRVSDGVEHWRGIRFSGRNQATLDFASFVCPDTALGLDPNCALTLNNCLVEAFRPIAGDSQFGIRSGDLWFANSVIRCTSTVVATGGRIIASHTIFDFGSSENREPGFWTPGTRYVLTSCAVIGAIHAEEGVVYADSCRFLRTPIGRPTGVGIGNGRMTESYVEGGVGVGRMDSRIPVIFRNNVVEHSSISGTVNVTGCMIKGLLRIDFCEAAVIRNTTIYLGPWIGNSNFVAIDSCFCSAIDGSPNSIVVREVSRLAVTRSVLKLKLSFGSDYAEESVLFDHNIVIPVEDGGWFQGISAPPEVIWTNNIFLNPFSPDTVTQLFSSHDNFQNAKYNCVWGFEYAGSDNSEPGSRYLSFDEMDSSNVVADPQLVWDDCISSLSEISPCIDAGDPDFPNDPDGTRSDIGSRFYDQRLVIFDPSAQFHPEKLSVGAYPNPFNNNLTVTISGFSSIPQLILLVNQSGRIVSEKTITTGGAGTHIITLDTGSLPSGTYFVTCKSPHSLNSIPVNCLK